MNIQKFVIVSYGRTGSNYLVNSLNTHHSVSCYWEVFNLNNDNRGKKVGEKYEEGDDPFEYARKYIWENPELAEIRGYKVFYFHCANKDKFWQKLKSDPSIKVIHLVRDNLFLKYLSGERARLAAVWHPSGKNPNEYYKAVVSLKIDTRRMLNLISHLKSQEKQFRDSVEKQMLEVSYEGLAGGSDLGLCFNYLGIDGPKQAIEFSKSAINPNLIQIENPDEVEVALESVGYSHWYEEFLQN